MEGEKIEKSYNHIAFKIDESDYEMYLERIKNLGLGKKQRGRFSGATRLIIRGMVLFIMRYKCVFQ
jgi:hypothetical protein